MTHLLWVAVPNGIRPSGEALIRVLVVPRLDEGALSDFGLEDWPSTLGDTILKVRTKTSAGVQSAFLGPPREAGRSEVWRAFFGGPAGIVEPPVRAAPGAPTVADTHGAAGAVTAVHQRSTVELAAPGPDTERRLRERIVAWHAADDGARPAAAPPPPPPFPDFHRAVSLLREHPAVLGDLGLVFEILVDPARLAAGDASQERYVAVMPDTPLPVRVISPWSRFDLSPGRFWPAGSRTGIQRGVLDLRTAAAVQPAPPETAAPPPPWAIATFDVDGGQHSLREAARSLVDDPGRPPALPALRSAGLLLIRPQRQVDFHARAASASRRTALEEEQHLTADELTLGYRVDVRGEDSTWRSLCRRRVAYRVKEQESENRLVLGGSPRVFEEGHVKPFAAARDEDGALHADQVVLRWDGWSLVLPRIDPLHGPRPPAAPRAPALPYEFSWDSLRPGEELGQPGVPDDRLPRLRFSVPYQLRIRVADVTGGGPGPEDVEGNQLATQEVLYTRHDPVRPPLLTGAGGAFTPGAAIDRLVLRSDRGLTAEEFAAAEPRYASMERRTLLRPSVSFELAEQHGTFDVPGDERTLQWAQLALRPGLAAGLPDPAADGVNAYVAAESGGLSAPISDHRSWARWPDPAPLFLRLTDETDGRAAPVSLHWSGDTLVVGLRKGEQAVLQLSSRITPGMQDHFAWHDWLSQDVDGLTASIAGRNPAITPPRRIEIVHAVRRPAADPVWQLPSPVATRAEHATTAVLEPRFTSLDTDATGRLEIWARWEEWTDGGHEPAAPQLVHAQTIDRGDPPAPLIRHELGDTKHRTLHYTIKAVSRYRHYFFADEPDSAFELVREQDGPVNLLSSARPPALTLRGCAPSFHWHADASATRIERVRTPRIRVEVARPWYQTGEGESLGVIVAAGQPSAAVASWLTQVGRDPIAASPALPRFPAASWLTAAAGGAARLTPAELSEQVDVVPHAVASAADHWYADVALDPPVDSYMPLVRLALVRFQPDSLPGLQLSPIVITELVPLLPPRRLLVERRDAELAVTLTGPGPNPPNRFEVTVEACSADAPADLGDGGLVVLDASADVPGWRPSGGPPASAPVGGTAILARPAAGGRARLRVHEVEALDEAGVADRPELGRRSVYFDVVELPAAWLAV